MASRFTDRFSKTYSALLSCITPLCLLLTSASALAQEKPIPQSWPYAAAMKKVASSFTGNPGVVLHVGDSITYSNPYGQWARAGRGKSSEDQKALDWMHCGADDDSDGWWLCRFDHPSGGRSHTAASGIRLDAMLKGGRGGMLSLEQMLDKYGPQIVVLMLGSNDASEPRSSEDFNRDMCIAVGQILDHHAICIISTIPPRVDRLQVTSSYNDAIRRLAREKKLPLIDFEREILSRRPHDWPGTLIAADGVHPSADVQINANKKVSPSSEPSRDNLRRCGYLLRGWLSVKKIAEVKRTVIDSLKIASKNTPHDRIANARQSSKNKLATTLPQPKGIAIRVPITRDTWFSCAGKEGDGNCGGSGQLKLKSIQEMTLVDFDPAPLAGHIINGAILHVKKSGKEVLHRVSASTFAAPWVEGTATSYQQQAGASTFNSRQHPNVPWAYPGSDLTAVMLGQGGTIWRMADVVGPDKDGWQQIPIDPEIIAARVAGTSHGILLMDDVGSEWTRNGERFTPQHMPNRFVHSRESGKANAPYLTVFLGPLDRKPPPAPTKINTTLENMPAGDASVSWATPADPGSPRTASGTIGFLLQVNGQPVPRYLIPAAGKPGETVSMRIGDLGIVPGGKARLKLKVVDAAGNVSTSVARTLRVSAKHPKKLPGKPPRPFTGTAPLPRLGQASVSVIDALDKVHPISGEMIPAQSPEYLSANHLFSAERKQIRLASGRNEFVAFQILIQGQAKGLQPCLKFEQSQQKIQVTFGKYAYVPTEKGPLPDPILRLQGPTDIPDGNIAAEKSHNNGSLLCEVFIPAETTPGRHNATLTLQAGDEVLEIELLLWVWDFTLPDQLSFIPEMNCYELPAGERDYYRMAHAHRTVLNRLPYSQAGRIAAGCAPAWDGSKLDWTAWDKRFGQYLDGTAFADLPRRGVPLECFYLPLHENWPAKIDDSYNGEYWIDRAFDDGYRNSFVKATTEFARHFREKGWTDTFFHCYLNNKHYFKKKGWSRGSSPWLLDEPVNFQDFWALRYFGEAFIEGLQAAAEPGSSSTVSYPKLCFRCDISKPEWQRDALDHVLDYNVAGGGHFHRYNRLMLQRKNKFGQTLVTYGSANAIDKSNMQAVGWSLDAWTLGADGVLPWQTIGNKNSWEKADRLSLFYPGGSKGPVPSIRLKAFRRGQQDIEYLTLFAIATSEPRWALSQAVRDSLHLTPVHGGTGHRGGEDAGVISFTDLRPQDAWALRIQLAREISKHGPKPRHQLVDLWKASRRREMRNSEPSPVYARGHRSIPRADSSTPFFKPSGKTQSQPAPFTEKILLQGSNVVADTIIDPSSPQKNFGKVQRDNRIKRSHQASVFLVRFDLGSLAIDSADKVAKATLTFHVWDPNNRSKSKVCVFGLKTPWEENAATWQSTGTTRWQGQDGFALVPQIAIVSPPTPRSYYFLGGLPSFPSRLRDVWSSRR